MSVNLRASVHCITASCNRVYRASREIALDQAERIRACVRLTSTVPRGPVYSKSPQPGARPEIEQLGWVKAYYLNQARQSRSQRNREYWYERARWADLQIERERARTGRGRR